MNMGHPVFVLSRLGCVGQRNPMPITGHAELNEACTKSWARRLLDAMYSVGARWLSSATHALKPRPGGPIKPDGAGDGIPDVMATFPANGGYVQCELFEEEFDGVTA